MPERVLKGLPFGREGRERVEDGAPWLVGRVHEQCNGRSHLLVRGDLEDSVRLRRAFDEHDVRLELGERTR